MQEAAELLHAACLMRRNSMQGRPAWWHASLYTEKRPYACKRSDAAFSKQEEVGDDEATARKWEHAAAANSPTFPLSLPLVRSFLASFLCNRSNGFSLSLLPAQTDREPSLCFLSLLEFLFSSPKPSFPSLSQHPAAPPGSFSEVSNPHELAFPWPLK